MIQRHAADGFEIAVEHRIDDRSANALAGEIGELPAHRVRTLGKGVTDHSARLNNVAKASLQAASFGNGAQLERLADVPIYFADPIARRSEPLLRTADAQAPLATLPAALAEQLGVKAGELVTVSQGQGSVNLVAAIDTRLPANVVRVAAAHALTSELGDMFGPINVTKSAVTAAGEGK